MSSRPNEAKRVSEINATHALLERTAGVTLQYALAEFMTGPWHRHLIRLGVNGLAESVEWMDALDMADMLLAQWSAQPPTRRQAINAIEHIQPQIAAIWVADGAPAARVHSHYAALLLAIDDTLRPEEPDQHKKQEENNRRALADKPPGKAEFEAIEQLRVGDWLAITGLDGTARPAKLSWVSPISGKRLFVNRQGVRVMVATTEELAGLLRIERLKIN